MAFYDHICALRVAGHHITIIVRGIAASMGGISDAVLFINSLFVFPEHHHHWTWFVSQLAVVQRPLLHESFKPFTTRGGIGVLHNLCNAQHFNRMHRIRAFRADWREKMTIKTPQQIEQDRLDAAA